MFCCHKYKTEKTIEQESAYEQISKRGSKLNIDAMGPWLFKRHITTIIRCEKCGKVKHIKS